MRFFLLFFTYAVFTGSYVFPWTVYNGHELMKLSQQHGRDAGYSACNNNFSIMASPLDTTEIEAVIQLTLETSPIATPEISFWTGFKRDPSLSNEWIGNLYHASNVSINWKSGYTGVETGDCLAMEVMPFSITFYPEACTTPLHVMCHKLQATYPVEEQTVMLLNPPHVYGEINNTTADDCTRLCALDLSCTGYSHDAGICYTYNEASFVNGSVPEIVTSLPSVPWTDTNGPSTQWTFTQGTFTQCSPNCGVVDCFCNDTFCKFDSCSLPSGVSNCTFTNCSDISVCLPFDNSTCSLNGTNVYINCTVCDATTIQLSTEFTTHPTTGFTTHPTTGLTTHPTTEITSFPTTVITTEATVTAYTYFTINGCVVPYVPNEGSLKDCSNTTYNSTCGMKCGWDYEPILQENDTMVCGYDRKWSLAPACVTYASQCPIGWYEYSGGCYQIQSAADVSWFDQSCDSYNAHSVHINSENEALFIDKFLHYHQNKTFWTGGANVNVRTDSLFYWKHNYQEIEYTRWNGGNVTDFTDNQCISLTADNGIFYFERETCTTLHSYICRKGRVLIGGPSCLRDSWCIGNAECSDWNSKCYCAGALTLYGDSENDPTAYCGNVKISVMDSMLIHQDTKSWELSATECESRGGSLLTVFTKDWEDILFTNFGSSGVGKLFWSIFKFENGSFYTHGIPHYNVTDLTQIPWLSPIQNKWYKDEDCVYQRISELGVRYGVAICDPKWGNKASICQLVDYSSYYQSNKDNIGRIPLIEHNLVLNNVACYLKCQYNQNCRSISYYQDTLTCKLYSTIDPGTYNDSPNEHMYREECRLPSNPLFGSLTSLPSVTPVGTTVDYTCDTGYRVPDLYDDFLTCSSSGTWSNVPKCVFDGLQCDQGWEQESTSCYRVIERKVPWLTAVTVCLNNGATLIEVYSEEEMDFIKTLLDHNSNEPYWSGGNCRIMNGFYSWSSNLYSQWTYTRWAPAVEPSGAGQCVALKRKFEGNDTNAMWYSSSDCGALSEYFYKPYICKKNLLNVGSLNCSRFGADPCKQNSECIDEKCICKPFFYQLGLDDVTSTECLPIQPVGSGPCYDMAEFCMSNSTCISDTCTCPSGWYQNGMSGSLSTICQTSPVSCPVSWVQHDGHCYFMDEKNYMGSSYVEEDSDPAVHCGALKAYMAVIPDAATNEVIRQLGLGPSYRFIGLVDEFRKEDYVWLGEESSLTYTNFEFDNTSAQIGVIMNPIGYWVKTTYVASVTSILVTPIPKDKIVCEKPHLCSPIPPISNALVPPVAVDGEHVGKEYLYACDTGYVLGGLSYPFIRCRETNRVSSWDSIPQCFSLLAEKYIDVSATTVKGTLITSSVETTNQMCAVQCYQETLCEAFYYSPTTKECILYDLQSELYTIAAGAEIWKTAVCDSIPYVEHAVIKVTGRSFGDKVTYECPSNRRIARNTSATLTCLPTGRWDKEPPYCEGRFERQSGAIYKVGTTGKQKMYHNIFTVDDCEVKCTEETRFRCMLSVYRQGTCHLWSKLTISEANNPKHELFTSGAYSSSLQDADVDMYFKTDDKIITSDVGVTYTNVSYEICAQKCGLDENTCTVFDYRAGIGTCIIHTIPDVNSITYAADLDFQVYTRLYTCGAPPVLQGITFEEKTRQSQDAYYIGDVLQAKCDIFGEELVADHDGQIECLATGLWTPRHPACRNLCESGWYMFNKTCYRLYDTPMTFWDAYTNCHSQNSGLINVYTTTEFSHITNIWNQTGSSSSDTWVGLYSDSNTWYWSERLGGNISFIESAMYDMAVTLTFNDLSLNSTGTTTTHPYACEKAAASLACPTGWIQFKNKCFQTQTTPVDFNTAQTNCESLDSKLATLDNIRESYILSQLANETAGNYAFVGLHHIDFGEYQWVDGTVPAYKYIKTQESSTIAKCGAVLMVNPTKLNLKFDLLTCTTAYPYICQKFIDYAGVATDFSNLPCSTDGLCSNPDLACLGGVRDGVIYSPRCSGKECPPPWRYINNKCVDARADKKMDYSMAAHYCWSKRSNLLTIKSFKEIFNVMEILPTLEKKWNIGYYSYIFDTVIDIKTKRPTVFTPYNQDKGGFHLDVDNVGIFVRDIIWIVHGFICEKDPVFKHTNDNLYEGCYKEELTPYERDLPHEVFTDSGAMTVEMCVNHCLLKGYRYAGIMNGDTCGCGDSRGNYGRLYQNHNCTIKCVGNITQECGGTAANNVYRTSEKICMDSMPRNPLDPRVCYSYDNDQQYYENSRYHCLHQGGYNIMPKTPVDESNIYNQLLLGAMSYDVWNDVNLTNPEAWLGVETPGNAWQDDKRLVEFANWDNKDYASSWKWAGQVDLSNKGTWRVDFGVGGAVKARTACELYDYDIKYTGSSLHTQYKDQYHPTLYTKYGEMNISSDFDFNCLVDRYRCPDGFTVAFWFLVNTTAEDTVILSSGDCSFKQHVLSPGLCVFYNLANQTVTIIHSSLTETVESVVAVNIQSWTHLLIHFDRNETISLYMNGMFHSTLSAVSYTVRMVNVIQEAVSLHNTSDTKLRLQNITFVPAPPDNSLLEEIKEILYEEKSEEDMSWTSFQSWSVEPNPWNSPGIDGNGFILPYKSFVHQFDIFMLNSTCMHLQECWQSDKSISLWTKLPVTLSESVDIFSVECKISDSAGFRLFYDEPIKKMKVVFNSLNMYSAEFNVTLGEWSHIVLVISQPVTPTLYVNGSLVQVLTNTGTTPDGVTVRNNARYLGTVMCPPGWSKYGTSCYKYTDQYLMYWEHEHICRGQGGHLVAISDESELNFVKTLLYDKPAPVYFGTYDFHMDYSSRLFMNTDGKRQPYTFWETNPNPLLNTPDLCYTAITCDPDCGTAELHTFKDNNVNFTGYGGLCENAQEPFSTRIQDGIKCSDGWEYFDGNCYLFTNTTSYTGPMAHIHCSGFRAIVVEIDSEEEQRFISNLLNSGSPLPKTAHIGPKFRTLADSGIGEFTHGDLQPLKFEKWATPPLNNYASTQCAVIDCSDRKCQWRDIICSGTWPVICEKPAKSMCSPSWEEFGNRCISIHDVTTTEECTSGGSKLLTFNNVAEVDEFRTTYDLVGKSCLTDGVLSSGSYIWSSTGESAYFDTMVSGTGNCVGITSTGLQKLDCTLYTCAICQHSQLVGGVSIDNVHFMDNGMNAAAVTDLYDREKYLPETFEFDMTAYNMTTNVINGEKSDGSIIELASSENITILNDLALGSVLHKGNFSSSALVYSVTENDSCLQTLSNCRHSFGVSFWLYVVNITDCVVIDTVTDGRTGMIISVTNDNETAISVTVKELNYVTYSELPVPLDKEWNHINIVWQKYVSLKFFINFHLVHTVSPTKHVPVFPATVNDSMSTTVAIANCTLELNSTLLIKDLIFGTNLKEDWENKMIDDTPRYIDFNEPKTKSKTNVHVILDNSLVETYWRNSLFLTAAKVDNPAGLVPAIQVPEQMMNCFSNNDACRSSFTLSLWLYPRNFYQDQTFLYSGVQSHTEGEIEYTRIWYDTTLDKYYLSLQYDKTKVVFDFYIYLFEWSHIVLSADFTIQQFDMYINSQLLLPSARTITFVPNRVIPVYRNSFLRIGDVGTFDIDDLKFFPYATEPSGMYVLKSCHEYMVAGLTGVKNESIDPDILDSFQNQTVEECNLDLGYNGFHFSMDVNDTVTNSIGLNTTINYLDVDNTINLPVIHYDGLYLNQTGFNITGLQSIKCFYDVKYCFFGFSFFVWIKVIDVSPSSGKVTLFEMGGDVTQNENGISVSCVNTTDITKINCSAIILNGTDSWTVEFSIMKKQLLHLTLTWNPHLTLIVALNGHSTADFGRYPEHLSITEASVPGVSRPVTIGYSVYEPDNVGELIVDELTIVDDFLEDVEIKKLFGTKHECPEGWEYIKVSDKCYYLSTGTAIYTSASTACTSMGATLAQLPNLATRTALQDFMFSVFQMQQSAWVALTQLPRAVAAFPIRQPNGKIPDFADVSLIQFPGTLAMPRCARLFSQTGTFEDALCSTNIYYICEQQPMYVKETPFYINGTNLHDTEYDVKGQILVHRGVTNESILFNQSYIEMIHADDCMSNFDYCHNGLTIKFWLMTIGNLSLSSKQVVYSNMKSENSHGISIYVTTDSSHYLLGVDVRNKISYMTTKVSVSSNAWTYVVLSITLDSQAVIYLNGELAVPITSNTNMTDVSIRSFGVAADITLGSGINGTNQGLIMMDNLTFTESSNLMVLPLKQDVYEFFPRLQLPFDDVSKRLPIDAGSTSWCGEGYFGNAIFSNSSSPTMTDFIGQFACDCFGSQNTCLEGFTMFVWIMTPRYTTDYIIFDNMNVNTGIRIDFRTFDFSRTNKMWLHIKQGTTIEKHYPFDLEPETWSHLGVTWYINGTTLFTVNGILMTDEILQSMTPVPGLDPVTKLQIDSTIVSTGVPVNMKGGVDELMVIRSPINQLDLIQFYENSTFLHKEAYCSFDDMGNYLNTSSVIAGVMNNAARLVSGIDSINMTSVVDTDMCFFDINKCVHGFTIRFAFRLVLDLDVDQVIMTTGGDNSDGLGFALTFTASNTSLPFRRYFQVDVRQSINEYTTWFNIQYDIWTDLFITWHPSFGIRVFIDGILAICDFSIQQARLSPPTILEQTFIIGQENGDSVDLGMFDIDELVILDVSVFGEEILQNGAGLWRHHVHKTPEADLIQQYTEVTRDECYQYCTDRQCDSYTVCDNEYYGTCNLYSNTTNTTFNDQSCDLFTRYLLDFFPVQDAGCLSNTSVSIATVLSPSMDSNTSVSIATVLSLSMDCSWYCKNISYMYSYVISTTCYCLNHDEDIVQIFDSENLTIINDCLHDQKIQQATGLRDFIQPLPIIFFNVTSSPGLFLLLNETLSLDFIVNDNTYAGYKVDAGDGRNVNYTSYNTTELSFHTQGFYFVQVTAMNEISSITVYVNVTVFIPVEGVIINNTKIVATNSAEQIIINIQQGTLITCDIDFGDGTNDTMFQPNSSIPFIFTHVYTIEQHADINVTCFNELSQEYNTSLLIAIDPIVNLSMMAPDSVIFGQNVSVDLFFVQGSNISMDIKWNNIMVLNPFYADPNGTISINVIQEIYNTTGEHHLNITVWNPVSGLFHLSHIVYIDLVIFNVSLNFKQFVKVNDNVSFELAIQEGSNMHIHQNFGESIQNDTSFIDDDSGIDNLLSYNIYAYTSPGEYLITYYLENSVSNMTVVEIIYVEVPVNNVTMVTIDVEDPYDFVNFTFKINNSLLPPTNAFMNISFGDDESLDEFSVEFLGTSMTVLHNYTLNGFYTVHVNLWNNVSSINFTQIVMVGRLITNLTVTPRLVYVPVGELFSIALDVGTGSQVSYRLDFTDGTINSTENIYTAPNAGFLFEKSFDQVGVYEVNILANGSFNSEKQNVTIYVQEKILGMAVLSRHIGKMNYPFYYHINLNAAGTNSCFVFDMGNKTQLVGDYFCQSKPEYFGMNFTYAMGNPIVFYLEFDTPGKYNMVVNGSNEVSYEIFKKMFIILQFPCTYPDVKIYGLSHNVVNPTKVYASDNAVIRAVSDTYCDPLQTVLFDWTISPMDPGMDEVTLDTSTLPYLILPANSLDYGLYQVNVTVLIQDYLEFNDTDTTYIEIKQTPLVLLMKGDDLRTIRSGSPLVMNASWSYDPDFPLKGIQYNFTWYCWYPSSGLYEFNISNIVLHEIGSASCFPTLDLANANWTVLTIPNALLNGTDYYFVGKMTSGNRLEAKAQQVKILGSDLPELVLKCMQNCVDVVSPSKHVRFKGLCETCTQKNRLGIDYNWRLFKLGAFGPVEIIDFATWTDTGVKGANIRINKGYLKQGQDYLIQLESGAAHTVKHLHVALPPYDGSCRSDITVGQAFSSKFTFSCGGWLDEGTRPARDPDVDSTYLYGYTFTFSYQVMDATENPIVPFFQVSGSEVDTPGVVLPPGKMEYDHIVKIIVDVTDKQNCYTNWTLDVQVTPFSEDSGHDVMEGFENNVCVREKDMSCILTFCDGLADTNTSHVKDAKLKDELINSLFNNKDLIQDGLHMKQTTSVLSKLTESTEEMSMESQAQMRNLFTGMVSSAQTTLSPMLSLEEKENMASDLLSSVTRFCQNTKYPPECTSGDCDQKLVQGNFAVELIDILHNLTGLLLQGNVAGESSTVIHVAAGNTKYQAQRRESFSLINMTMDFAEFKTIVTKSLPEEVTELETVDLEMMTSDNLYTVDQSTSSVKSQVTTFELLKDAGERIKVADLPAEIEVYSYPNGLNDLNYTYVNLSATTDSPMFFIELRLNETNVVPVLIVRPDDTTANITYYVRKGGIPSQSTYDIKGFILTDSEVEDSTNSYLVKMDISGLWTGRERLPTNVYIGLEADYNITEVSPMAEVAVLVLGCYYWSEQDKQWSQKGVKLGPVDNTTGVACQTNHLSAFGMNMFVPPNTIDFSTVFSKFSTDNLAVLITVGLVLLAYFLLLIPVIRADKRDFKKWAIYPLTDNVMTDVYHYQVSVYTGVRQNSGTTSKVYFVLGGEDGDTEVRLLQDQEKRPMLSGSVNNYLLSVPESLGNLLFLRIWLDNTKIDDWLLNMILVRDVQSGERYAFLCDKWFAFDKGQGQIDHMIPVASAEEMQSFGHLFFSKTRKDMTDGHLWFSVASRPLHSTFTRAQRLSCCLSLLFMTMITNCMWYKSDSNEGDMSQNVHLGPFTFSSQEFFTSLFGTLIVVPFNLLIITLFRKSKPHTHASAVKVDSNYKEEKRRDSMAQFNRELDCASPSNIDPRFTPSPQPAWNEKTTEKERKHEENTKKKGKSKYPLPHWCIYIAWVMFALSVLAAGFFTVLYSMEWGSNKSSKWLTSFLLSFIESVILVQPLKVIVLAIVIALVLKTVDADDSVEEVFLIGGSPKTRVYPEHRQEFVHDPVDVENIVEAREHRLKMNRLFEVIRKIFIYVVYLSVVAVLAYENRDANSYPTYRNLNDIFITPSTKYDKSFSNLHSTRDFYEWMENIVLPGLYSNGWLNDSITDLEPFIIDNTFYRLGSPRIRQARIRNDDCKAPIQIRDYMNDCYPSYGTKTYESRNYEESWVEVTTNTSSDEAWIYKDTFDLDGMPTVGRYASYSGGGYVVNLGASTKTANDTLQYIKETKWIDKKTRGLFIEFNLFNPNVNLFCAVILLLEYPPTGSVFPYWEVNPIVMYRYVGPSAVFLFVFDFIFAAFTLYYLIEFIKELRKKGWRGYFTGLWNVVDFINIILSIICCAFYGMHFVITKLVLDKFHKNRDDFINLQRIVIWDQLFGIIIGFVLFLSMLKTLQLVRFNAKISQLYGTIKKSAKPLINYMIVFLVSFTAFISCGYLLFGPHDYEYSSFIRTTETLMSMLMMKVNIDTVLIVSGLLGSLYIFIFVLFVVFILLNILLSIINEAFAESRRDPSCRSDDPQMVDFLLSQLKTLIWGATETKPQKNKDVIDHMDKLERRMDRYFIRFLADEKENPY